MMMDSILTRALNFEPISIVECEKLAQDVGFDSTTFLLVGPFGLKKARWLDAYFGMLTFDGLADDKMVMTSQLADMDGISVLNVDWPGRAELQAA